MLQIIDLKWLFPATLTACSTALISTSTSGKCWNNSLLAFFCSLVAPALLYEEHMERAFLVLSNPTFAKKLSEHPSLSHFVKLCSETIEEYEY